MCCSNFTLTPTAALDIPILAQNSQEAFSTDSHTRLKELVEGYDHALEMASVLSSWLSHPKGKCIVMKIVIPD
jgi:hypothetical protein